MPEPLISIICVVRNRAQCIGRAVASILALEDPTWELIIQDGASTDGTLEILQALADPRIHLVSEPDDGPEDGFFRALRRCRGEYIGCCLSDEEYLPHTLGWVRREFAANPGAGAIYGQCYATDLKGNIESTFTPVHPFTLERYLRHEVVPPFVASFFRATALQAAGWPDRPWRTDVGEFELWTRVAQVAPVVYVPEVVGKYGVHDGCRSRTSTVMAALVRRRREFLDAFFAEPGLTPRIRGLRDAALAGLHLWLRMPWRKRCGITRRRSSSMPSAPPCCKLVLSQWMPVECMRHWSRLLGFRARVSESPGLDLSVDCCSCGPDGCRRLWSRSAPMLTSETTTPRRLSLSSWPNDSWEVGTCVCRG
jgi:GT2 family glycosyltransferase